MSTTRDQMMQEEDDPGLCTFTCNPTDDISDDENDDISMNENSEEFKFPDPTKAKEFQGFHGRLVGCNGDCGSKIGKIIDHCIHHKV